MKNELCRLSGLALIGLVCLLEIARVSAQPPMPMTSDAVTSGTNAPVTYPATVSWDAYTNALRYRITTPTSTNTTTATNIVVGFTAGTNVVSVQKVGNNWTSAPYVLTWVGYPGVISVERVQRALSLTSPNWLDDTNTIRRVTNPPSGFFRYAATKYDTLIGGPQ